MNKQVFIVKLFQILFVFENIHNKIVGVGNSLVVQWLRLCTPDSGGLGSIPGQGTRSHMPQLRFYAAK